MTTDLKDELTHGADEGTGLGHVFAAPTIWALHFLVIYPGVAVYCAKLGRTAPLQPMRWIVLGATAIALAAIGVFLVRSWRRHRFSVTDRDLTFEANTAEERHRFLTHLSLTLCALSIVGVLYTTLPILLVETCR